MSNKNAKKATFKDLIAKKLQKEENANKTKDIYIESMDKTLTFKKASDDIILDALSEIGDGSSINKIVEAYKKLIYFCCPMLQDTELHKELEVINPFDVVDVLFSLGEVMQIGEQLEELIDINNKTEQIKN